MEGCPDEPCQATSSSRYLNDYLEIINRKGLPGKDKTDLCLQVQDPVTATVQYIRASVVGLNGTGGGAAYIAAKHGVVGLTRQMAVVYTKRGITINCVCPGAIPTNLREHSQELLGPNVPDIRSRGVAVNEDQIRDLIPAGTRGSVDDIASAVCFLASDEAAYISGHHLVVDGGWRAK